MVDSPRLRKLCLLLRGDLKESDIPHHTTIRDRIDKAFKSHMTKLEEDLGVSLILLNWCLHSCKHFQNAPGKISFTTDTWTDPNQHPFMAVTAHWMEIKDQPGSSGLFIFMLLYFNYLHLNFVPLGLQKKLNLRSDLIGFRSLPGRHTGEHMAHCFLHITDRIKITPKASVKFVKINGK